MRIRCGSCHDTIWIQPLDQDESSAVVRCDACSQEYDLRATIERVSSERFYDDAREFARTSEIDLPAACSVLLGISSIDRVRDLCGSQAPSSRPVRFDPSFRTAVEAGWLTAAQAAMRGKREVFARRLVERHGLSEQQALEVADNKVPLLEAVRRNRPAPRLEVVSLPRTRRRGPSVAVAIFVLLLVASGIAVTLQSEKPQPVEREVRSSGPKVIASLEDAVPELVRNDRGELVEISAGNPRSILDTYCRTLTRGTVDPVAIERAGDGWTGLYRQNGRLYGITIRRDAEREVWVAGNSVDRLDGQPIATQ
jgi:hypothetical protein